MNTYPWPVKLSLLPFGLTIWAPFSTVLIQFEGCGLLGGGFSEDGLSGGFAFFKDCLSSRGEFLPVLLALGSGIVRYRDQGQDR